MVERGWTNGLEGLLVREGRMERARFLVLVWLELCRDLNQLSRLARGEAVGAS